MTIAPPAALQPAEAYCPASRMRYLTAGSADRAVVLLHGWADTKEIWRSTLGALAGIARAYAPDLPGHGESPLGGAARMSQVAERVAAFCAAHGLAEVTLVGHSMGGNLAAEVALTRPELVRRLVLVAPAACGRDMPVYTRLYLREPVGWAALRASLAAYRALGALAGRISSGVSLPIMPPALRRTAGAGHIDPASLHQMLDMLFANMLLERLPTLRVPTLVVTGAYDLVVPASHSRCVTRAIPGARLVVIPGAGHHPMDDRPAIFERAVRAFVGAT